MQTHKMLLILGVLLSLYTADSFAEDSGASIVLPSFNSRSDLSKKFGKKITRQIPIYFDFENYKLVLVNGNAQNLEQKTVVISEPKEGSVNVLPFSFLSIHTNYKNQTADIIIFGGGAPCSSPVDQPDTDETRRQMKACYAVFETARKEDEKKISFFAFPKSVKVTASYGQMEPRP